MNAAVPLPLSAPPGDLVAPTRFDTVEEAQQHLRNILAFLDMPTLAQPEAFIQSKEGLFDAAGNIGSDSRQFLQNWVDRYAAWVVKHAA